MNTQKDIEAFTNSFHSMQRFYDAKIDLAHELHNLFGDKEDAELEHMLDTLELTIRDLKRKLIAKA